MCRCRPPRVVLPGEDLACVVQHLARRGLQREAAVLATELPDDAAAERADLVGRPRVTRVDQQVPVGVQVHGVDVEPVPWRARGRRQRLLALAERHVILRCSTGTAPAGGDVDLLHDAVDHRLIGRTADRGEVGGRRRVGQDQRRVPGRDQELMAIRAQAVAGVDGGDLLVVARCRCSRCPERGRRARCPATRSAPAGRGRSGCGSRRP